MTERQTPVAKSRPRMRLWFGRSLLVIGAVVVALFLVEIGLRVAGFHYFNPYIADRDVGYSLRPGAEGWWTREGRTYIKINSQGFRDREHSIAKPAGTFRIAILGDSFAEALQVPLEKAFWSVLEKQVAACTKGAKPKIEVLNFGVSGFSTARELILLRTRVWSYSPDLVLLLVTPANDIRDNSRELTRYRREALPYFVFQDGKLVLDDSVVAARNRTLTFRFQTSNSFNWLRDHLRILGLVYTLREAWQSSRMSNQQSAIDAQTERGLDSEVYRRTASPEWEDAWRLTEALLVKMRDEVQIKGARFLVATGSAGIQVTPDSAAREEYMKALGVDNLSYPEERIRALGQAEKFSVLNLSAPLRDYALRNNVFVQGTRESGGRGHWNGIGHQLAGELIAAEICRSGF